MISGAVPQLPDLLVAVLFGLTCFMAGVAWAVYRALDWVDRMRTWARTVPCPDEEGTGS